MPKAKKNKQSTKVEGLKYLKEMRGLFDALQQAGCDRDRANNRELHYDQYCMLILLYLFSPAVKSLRSLQQATELKKVQKKLGCKRASLGSLSESTAVFDPELLKPIIESLGEKLKPVGQDHRLADLKHTLTLVDGSLVEALPRMAEAALRDAQPGNKSQIKWTLHTHFEVDRSVPSRIDVTPTGGGESDERAVMEKAIESDRTYVMDRGYAKFTLFNAIADAGSSYVCRVRDNSVYEVLEERELTEQDQKSRVISDTVVQMGKSSAKADRPNHVMRFVQIEMKPHEQKTLKNGKKSGPECDGVLRIVTNLLDVPAEIIALLYQYRWTIEIFFRFLKHILGCRHLLSQSPEGIKIQAYCAIIACMLITLWTGKKPTLRTHEMICWYLLGVASEEELLAHIEKLKKQNQ